MGAAAQESLVNGKGAATLRFALHLSEVAPTATRVARLREQLRGSQEPLEALVENVLGHFEGLRDAEGDKAETLRARFETADEMQCAYYGNGSCPDDPDACQVCCWFDDDPEPLCYCEDC
jgi:hypothetical protein